MSLRSWSSIDCKSDIFLTVRLTQASEFDINEDKNSEARKIFAVWKKNLPKHNSLSIWTTVVEAPIPLLVLSFMFASHFEFGCKTSPKYFHSITFFMQCLSDSTSVRSQTVEMTSLSLFKVQVSMWLSGHMILTQPICIWTHFSLPKVSFFRFVCALR